MTEIIFRKFNNGEVIALMPELANNHDSLNYCDSYMHIGQHGAASVDLVNSTRLASEAEYTPLLRELKSIGYEVKIIKRMRVKHLADRRTRQYS